MHPRLLVERERNNRIYCGYNRRAGKTVLHFHSSVELLAVHSGEIDVWVNGNYRRLKAGDIAYLSSYDAHRYEPVGEDAVSSWLIVPATFCQELSDKITAQPFIHNAQLFCDIDKLLSLIACDKNSLLTNGCVSVVFGLLLEHLDFHAREKTGDADSASQILLYLNDNFKNGISLTDTATHFGYNPSYLSRMFSGSMGIGFNEYLTMLRLREAVQLLKSGKSVSLCAYESGFNSVRTFYRAFFNEFGCTPKEYIKT